MSTNTIGTGALILSANADGMLAGIDKASKAADRAAKDIDRKLQPKGGKGFGGFAGGLAGGAAMGVVTSLVAKAVQSMIELVNGSRDFAAQMERSAYLTNEVVKSTDRMVKGWDDSLAAITNPADKLKELTSQIARSEKEQAGHLAKMAEARADLDHLKGDTFDAWETWAGGGFASGVAEAEERLKVAGDAASKFSDRLATLRDQAAKIRNPASDPALLGSINQLNDSLSTQIATIGLAGDKATIFGLKMRGATDKMLEGVEKLSDKLKEATLANEINEMTKGFKLQREQIGMNAFEAQVYALKVRGANEGMLANFKEEKRLLELALPPDVKLAGGFQKGSTGAYSIVAKNDAAGMFKENIGKQQLKAAQDLKGLLQGIWDELKDSQPLKAI